MDGDDGGDVVHRAAAEAAAADAPVAAAAVWKAAANALAWAASMRGMAARTEQRKAWESGASAARSAMRAAEASRGDVRARNRIDAAAIGRMSTEFSAAAEAAAQAAAAHGRTARLGRTEADDYERAAEAYARAATVERERVARRSASAALRTALAEAGQMADTAAGASKLDRYDRAPGRALNYANCLATPTVAVMNQCPPCHGTYPFQTWTTHRTP